MISDYDIIWITHPKFINLIEKKSENSLLVYDCMDDILEFPMSRNDPKIRQKALEDEKKVVDLCDIIFTSATNLKMKLIQRYNPKKEIHIVNNGIFIDKNNEKSLDLIDDIDQVFKRESVKIVYIGTLGEWLNMDIILSSLEKIKDIEYIFFGPNNIKLPKHPRITYLGPIEHKYVFELMKRADILIMPFKIDELTLSVNPVKLYEYIYACKPAIATEYGETLKFEKYVYLYNNKNEYIEILENLILNRFPLKQKCQDYLEFAYENTWDKRVKEIVNTIKKLSDKK